MTESISPGQENHTYQEDFQLSKKIFKQSLDQYQAAKATNFLQKQEAFKKPMQEALDVLNASASQLANDQLKVAAEKLRTDYAAFQQNDSKQNTDQLYSDLKQLG